MGGPGSGGHNRVVERLRVLRGGRRRAADRPVAMPIARLKARAEELEALGRQLLARARRHPTRKTHHHGTQPSAELSAALKLFEAADRAWARLQRLAPKTAEGRKKSKWDGLL